MRSQRKHACTQIIINSPSSTVSVCVETFCVYVSTPQSVRRKRKYHISIAFLLFSANERRWRDSFQLMWVRRSSPRTGGGGTAATSRHLSSFDKSLVTFTSTYVGHSQRIFGPYSYEQFPCSFVQPVVCCISSVLIKFQCIRIELSGRQRQLNHIAGMNARKLHMHSHVHLFRFHKQFSTALLDFIYLRRLLLTRTKYFGQDSKSACISLSRSPVWHLHWNLPIREHGMYVIRETCETGIREYFSVRIFPPIQMNLTVRNSEKKDEKNPNKIR